MLENRALFTPTMAKVLESQGYLREAGEIYSHLLEQMPGHTVFREKVAEIERLLAEKSAVEERLPGLFDQWLTLALGRRRLEGLRKLHSDRRRQNNGTKA